LAVANATLLVAAWMKLTLALIVFLFKLSVDVEPDLGPAAVDIDALALKVLLSLLTREAASLQVRKNCSSTPVAPRL
jgi:hypothetical protein